MQRFQHDERCACNSGVTTALRFMKGGGQPWGGTAFAVYMFRVLQGGTMCEVRRVTSALLRVESTNETLGPHVEHSRRLEARRNVLEFDRDVSTVVSLVEQGDCKTAAAKVT